MTEYLPIEIVGHILRVLAEMSILDNRETVLRIALMGSIGYTVAIPVLYRTVSVTISNLSFITRIFDDSEQAAASGGPGGVLQPSRTSRLCPYVRRIFVDASSSFPYLRLLPNLEMVVTITSNRGIFPSEDFSHLSKSLTQYTSLTTAYLYTLPPTITHASFYINVWAASVFTDFRKYASLTLHDTITHLAIELNDPIYEEAALQLRKLLAYLLRRSSTALVVLRLYRDAVLPDSMAAVLWAIHGLPVLPDDLQARLLIWRDQRKIDTVISDMKTSLRDAIEGRTPWMEGRIVSHADLEDANGLLD